MMYQLSVIIPILNEGENILPLLNDLQQYIPVDTEIIFVDDGSNDNSMLTLLEVSKSNSRVKCISLSRNFGHQNALMAGIEHAKGQYIITMDGDGQHPPFLIPDILTRLNSGFDVVHTSRTSTVKIGWAKKTFTKYFYKFINLISDTKIEANQSDFKGFNNKVLQSLLQFKERDIFLRGIFSWIGFKSTCLPFAAPARQFGKTKYSRSKMFGLALSATTSFSFKPLRITLLIGVMVSILAFGFGIFAFIAYANGNTVPGWASIIIATMFLGGVQLLATGLVGEYIASLFTESKKRPRYVIDTTINMP